MNVITTNVSGYVRAYGNSYLEMYHRKSSLTDAVTVNLFSYECDSSFYPYIYIYIYIYISLNILPHEYVAENLFTQERDSVKCLLVIHGLPSLSGEYP
jgi:hypothetical protein